MRRLAAALLALALAPSVAAQDARGPRAARDAPAGVGWDGFPAFVWRQDARERPLAPELVRAFGGTNVEGAEDLPWTRALGLDTYVGHAPGRDALHLERDVAWYDALWREFYATRDAAALVRVPCLREPATRAELEERLARSLAAPGAAGALAVSLGDEVGLTPWGDPLDLCASPACRAAWTARARALLPARALPEDPGLWPTTDATRLALLEGDDALLAPWVLRRGHQARAVEGVLAALAARARELAPGCSPALFGLAGETAFGGVSPARALRWVDVLEAYPAGDARELLYTARAPAQRSLLTLFPDDGCVDGIAWQLWSHWLRGGDGAIVWSDRELAARPDHARRLARALADLRALRAELGPWRPRPAGVALLHDRDSVALAWMRDALRDGPTWPRRFAGYQAEHGTRERALDAWLRLLEDVGLLPGALEEVDAGAAAPFPVLLACHDGWYDAERARGVRAALGAGATLLVHGPFWEHGRDGARAPEANDALFAELPAGRVRALDQGVDAGLTDYLARRLDPEDRGARRTRRRLVELLRAAGVAPPALTLRTEPPGAPLLLARCADALAPDAELWAALPNLPRPADRAARLRDVELVAAPPPGARVEWLHPRPDADGRVLLRAGDAAVLRLVRAE